MRLALALLLLLGTGCSTLRKAPSIRAPDTKIVGVPEQDQPVTLDRAETVIPVPANTQITVAPDGTATFTPAEPIRVVSVASRASSGGISQAVATAKVEAEVRQSANRNRQYLGGGLVLVGLILAFALPPAQRWSIGGYVLAGVGVGLIAMPELPVWLAACALVLLGGLVVGWVLRKVE